MANQSIHTVPNPSGEGWANENDGTILSTHQTKEEAVERGREVAMEKKAEHVIHNADGEIAQSNSYGNDPNPPKDQR